MTVRTIDDIFRDFVIDGMPASGPFHPYKPDIRDTLKKLLEGISTFPDNRVIRLNNANTGTANNIIVTASVAIPAAAYQVLYILNVTQENTGAVTVSGAVNRALVTNTSAAIPSGYLTPGMAVLCIDTGSELRMLSYGDMEILLDDVEAALAAAQAAQAAAEQARDEAVAAASDAVSQGNVPIYSTRNAVETLEIPAGITAFRTNGFASVGDGGEGFYVWVATEPTHIGKVQSADGAWWKLVGETWLSEQLGLTGSPDQAQMVSDLIDYAFRSGIKIDWKGGDYYANTITQTYAGGNLLWRSHAGKVRFLPVNLPDPASTSNWRDLIFMSFLGQSAGAVQATGSIWTGGSSVGVTDASGFSVGDMVALESDSLIDTDPRASSFYGRITSVDRVNGNSLTFSEAHPYSVNMTQVDGTITAVGTNSFTASGLIGRAVSLMRGRVIFTSGANSGKSAVIAHFDTATGICSNTTGTSVFPSGLAVGDTFSVANKIRVRKINAIFVDIDGDFEFFREPTFDATTGDGGHIALDIEYAFRPRLAGVRFHGFADAGLRGVAWYDWTLENIRADYANRAYNVWDGSGYGVTLGAACYGHSKNVSGFACRRVLDLSGYAFLSVGNIIEDTAAHGGGVAYDGVEFWPIGATEQNTCGSHGGAMDNVYLNSSGYSVGTVLNFRGKAEVAKGINGWGRMRSLVLIHGTSDADMSDLYYNSRQLDTRASNSRTYTSAANQYLDYAIKFSVDQIDVQSGKRWSASGFNLKGVALGIVDIASIGNSIPGFSLSDIRAGYTQDGGSTVPFRIINVPSGWTLENPIIIDGFSLINASGSATPTVQIFPDLTTFSMSSRAYVKYNNTYFFSVADDAVKSLPAHRGGEVTVSLINAVGTSAAYRILNGVIKSATAGDNSPLPNSSGVNVVTGPLSGTTGADGAINVALNPGSSGALQIENRTGAIRYLALSSHMTM